MSTRHPKVRMPCPACGVTKSGITETRPMGQFLRRRRECPCGNRWSTVEIPIETADMIACMIKKSDELLDGLTQFTDRAKKDGWEQAIKRELPVSD